MLKITKKQDITLQLKYGIGYIEYSESDIITPVLAYHYACEVINGPWPLGEKAIVNDPEWAYCYAVDIIEGPWPPGEEIIAIDPERVYNYAYSVIRGPWTPGEATIARDPEWAYYYALDVIKAPWPLGEEAIFTNLKVKSKYEDFLKRYNRYHWNKV